MARGDGDGEKAIIGAVMMRCGAHDYRRRRRWTRIDQTIEILRLTTKMYVYIYIQLLCDVLTVEARKKKKKLRNMENGKKRRSHSLLRNASPEEMALYICGAHLHVGSAN